MNVVKLENKKVALVFKIDVNTVEEKRMNKIGLAYWLAG